MTRVLLAIALAGACQAQVQARFSPEPMEVLKAMNVKKLGVWSVSLCNDCSRPVIIPRERIIMAAGALHIVDPVRARAVLSRGRSKTKKAVIAEAIEYLLLGVAVFGGQGSIAMKPRVLGDIALATGVAHTVQDRLRGQLPDLGPFTEGLLTEAVSLAPGQCATRTVFAALMHDPQPITATILVAEFDPTPRVPSVDNRNPFFDSVSVLAIR